PENQLNIMPYNRVVRDLNNMSTAEFVARVESVFEITPSAAQVVPDGRHHFGMYLEGRWYHLRAKAEIINEADTVSRLDVSILQDRVLNPMLGIDNPRTNNRIHFVG